MGTQRTQATLIIDVPELDRLRARFDPDFAERVLPHVTLVYDDEAPDASLLASRLANACSLTPPIRLKLHQLQTFAAPDEGLFVDVDASAEFDGLRQHILVPPFRARGRVKPHVTIVHPRRVGDAKPGWRQLVGQSIDLEIAVSAVGLFEWDGSKWNVRESFPLLARS